MITSFDQLSRAIDHIFLPPKLPQCEDTETEKDLPPLVLWALEQLNASCPNDVPPSLLENAVLLLKGICTVHQVQGIDETVFIHCLNNLAPGQMLAINVKAQNAGITISRLPNHLLFETFELSPRNEAVMTTKGRLSRTFPDHAIVLEDFYLTDADFAQCLAATITKMSHQHVPGMQPVSSKTGDKPCESRDTTDPSVVLDLLFGVLKSLGGKAPIQAITKYTREDVLWDDCELPWRRSPTWLLIRVALQFLFVRGKDGSILHYKKVTTYIMAYVLKHAVRYPSMDMIRVMQTKIHRRLMKIRAPLDGQSVEMILLILNDSQLGLKERWQQVQHDDTARATADLQPLALLDFEADTRVSLPALDEHIAMLSSRNAVSPGKAFTPVSGLVSVDADELPSLGQETLPKAERIANLQIFEDWVTTYLRNWQELHRTEDELEQLLITLKQYHQMAALAYGDNPEGLSVMLLTLFSIWIAIDTIAVRTCQILRDYSPDIPIECFTTLLLKSRRQMTQLAEVEQYIRSREGAMSTELLFSTQKFSSFAVRYFDQSRSHRELLTTIELEGEAGRQRKLRELEYQKSLYVELDTKFEHSDCEYTQSVVMNIYGETEMTTSHRRSCQKCMWKKQRDDLSVKIHEWPLPDSIAEAKAVVFELNVPDWYALWRDSCSYLALDVLKCTLPSVKVRAQYRISHNDPHLTQAHYRRAKSCRLTLLSEAKPWVNTHFKNQSITSHTTESDVCKRNGLQYRYFDQQVSCFIDSCLHSDNKQRACMYKLPEKVLQHFIWRPYSQPDGPPPNEIIARQDLCPENMTLEEFETLATVPFGLRLQWSNIQLQLACPSVDFRQLSTFLVFCQCMYQTGPQTGGIYRLAHGRMEDEHFVASLLSRLEDAIQRVRSNWESVNAIATFSSLATRISSLNDAVSEDCLRILADLRGLTAKWTAMLDQKACSAVRDIDRAAFSRKCVQMALVCLSTFDLDDDKLTRVLQTADNVSMLVQMSVVIGQSPDMSDDQLAALLQLRATRTLHRSIATVANCSSGLDAAVQRVWSGFETSGAVWQMSSTSSDQWMYTLTKSNQTVHINVLNGEMLVDGLPIKQAPAEYQRQPLFSVLFGDRIVKVVPGSIPGFSLSVKDLIWGYKLHLGLCSRDGLLVHATKDTETFEIIPCRLLSGIYPAKFVSDCVHWVNLNSGSIEVRPLETPWHTEDTHMMICRDHGTNLWQMEQNDSIFACLTSPTSRSICHILSPLAKADQIIISKPRNSNRNKIEVPKLRLSFNLEQGCARIESQDYARMRIDSRQDIGCLIGLVNKLVLTSCFGTRMVLIPESPLSHLSCSLSEHHTRVAVSRSHIEQVHVYLIDELLERLIDSGSLRAKLYLAYLHALTSSCLPDVLTLKTGTESALSILQSSVVLSYQEIDARDIELLEHLAALTPRRQYYPRHLQVMQQVEWSPRLGMLSQHSRFLPQVKAISEHYQHWYAVFQGRVPQISFPEFSEHDMHLQSRSQLRSAKFSSTNDGSEHFTSEYDCLYHSRQDTARSRRATVLANVALRPAVGPSIRVPHNWSLWSLFATSELRSHGPTFSLPIESLSYDCKFIDKKYGTSFILSRFMGLHRLLSLPDVGGTHKYAIAIWLATFTFCDDPDTMLLQLVAMFLRLRELKTILPPSIDSFCAKDGKTAKLRTIKTILKRHERDFRDCPESQLRQRDGEEQPQFARRRRQAFNTAMQDNIDRLAQQSFEQWPTQSPIVSENMRRADSHINLAAAADSLQIQFSKWHNTLVSFTYLEEVQSALLRCRPLDTNITNFALTMTPSHKWSKCYFDEGDMFNTAAPDLSDCLTPVLPGSSGSTHADAASLRLTEIIADLKSVGSLSQHETKYIQELELSAAALSKLRSSSSQTLVPPTHIELITYLSRCEAYLACCFGRIQSAIATGTDTIQQAPQMSNGLILRQICRDRWQSLSSQWKCCMLRMAVALTQMQRAKRMLASAKDDAKMQMELENVGHTNWSPMEHPEVLLMEIESNILIREVQMDVAAQMISPDGSTNATMVLVMGQGKSSVLVPIVATAAAKYSALARVIVGKPQSKQMAQMLRAKLGGMINRQIYFMPFTRKLQLNKEATEIAFAMMKGCLEGGGVLLMQPEHILSFQLMALERYISGEAKVGERLSNMQDFLHRHCRDIVDECDENFNVKFELIYSMGQPNLVDEGSERWRLWQEVLGVVRAVLPSITPERPDYFQVSTEFTSHFPRIRVLHADGATLLTTSVADRICSSGVSGLQIPRQSEELQSKIHCYLTKSDIDPEEIQAVEQSNFWTQSTKHRLFLLRGALAGGLLTFVLGSKRWRVHYGSTTRRPPTRLAVPYLAKDCPSARSEFSHPDVVILLTCLNYYYSGLQDDELVSAFAHLSRSDEADAEYAVWKRDADNLPREFQQLQGVNLEDQHQCIADLFPRLKYSKGAIDYYLDRFVFAKEMKEFPLKLSASGWDIGRAKAHLTTGFSGTNDSYPMLPLSMRHIPLAASRHTNAVVLEHLLRPENTVNLLHKPETGTCDDAEFLLSVICGLQPPVQVVLDVGAQVIEMTNVEFAARWLIDHTQDKEAVVYVDEQDEICVIDRGGHIAHLSGSRFSSRLSACLVFLDEAHTRGIDLQLPIDYRAAVTLGAGLTKDRLVQACMRMRQLGNGQSVVFCIQEEIERKIRERTSTAELGIKHVLIWAISETHAEIRRSMPLFATQGERFFSQQQLWHESQDYGQTRLSHELATRFQEKEALTIEERYATSAGRPRLFENLKRSPDISIRRIADRLNQFDNIEFRSAGLQEEQERELAPEAEQERQRQLPPRVEPLKHNVHPLVERFVITGIMPSDTGTDAFVPAFDSLAGISAASEFDISCLDVTRRLFVTVDFARTVYLAENTFGDAYQRPVQWVAVSYHERSDNIRNAVILSPYEANHLFDTFRHSKTTSLHLYKPRCNVGYPSLDELDFSTSTGRDGRTQVPPQLAVWIALFAGELYLPSHAHYIELCTMLGLATDSSNALVDADGFIKQDEAGIVGGRSGLSQSPVRFFEEFFCNVRRRGEGIKKTHMGRLLDGELLHLNESWGCVS